MSRGWLRAFDGDRTTGWCVGSFRWGRFEVLTTSAADAFLFCSSSHWRSSVRPICISVRSRTFDALSGARGADGCASRHGFDSRCVKGSKVRYAAGGGLLVESRDASWDEQTGETQAAKRLQGGRKGGRAVGAGAGETPTRD